MAPAISCFYACPDAHFPPRSVLYNQGLLPTKASVCAAHGLGGLSPAYRLSVEGAAGLRVLRVNVFPYTGGEPGLT